MDGGEEGIREEEEKGSKKAKEDMEGVKMMGRWMGKGTDGGWRKEKRTREEAEGDERKEQNRMKMVREG